MNTSRSNFYKLIVYVSMWCDEGNKLLVIMLMLFVEIEIASHAYHEQVHAPPRLKEYF